jgi:hypothetical protein
MCSRAYVLTCLMPSLYLLSLVLKISKGAYEKKGTFFKRYR